MGSSLKGLAGNVVLMRLRQALCPESRLGTNRDVHIEGTAFKAKDRFLHGDMANSGARRVELNEDCYGTHLSQKWNFISAFVFSYMRYR